MSARVMVMAALVGLGCGDKSDDTAPSGDGADGASDGADGTTTDEPVSLDGACPQESRWGRFTVDSNEDYAAVSGQVADGVVPTAVLTNLVTAGDCTIWRRENPFCDPGCDPGFTCSLDLECVPYPENQDLGTVGIAGLSSAVSMEPVVPGYSYFDTSLDNPPWTAGDALTVRTGGGAFDPAVASGVAPEPLDLETVEWVLAPGEPFTVEWGAAGSDASTEVVLDLRIDLHGLTPSSLQCVFADTGEGVVTAETLDELIDAGLTGFPEGSLKRRTIDHALVGDGGCFDFVASSSRRARVDIEGYTPCRRDDDCPDGQECNEALERCE